ncbi:MAG: hypothetical protein JWM49_1659 [Microbacteriaceae bacterium]|nr:hypothetical protein [Microbacteriaceae bacterium]
MYIIGAPRRPAERGDTGIMTNFFSLVKYLGIAVLIFMALVLIIATIISVIVALQPNFIPGLFAS